MIFSDDEIAKANSTDLLTLAEHYGYESEKCGSKAYHLKHSGGLYIFLDSNKYYHHTGSDADKKGGAVDFVMKEEGLSFSEAVAKLLGSQFPFHTHKAREPTERGKLILPDKAPNFKRAYWYLASVRGIEPEIVSYFMNQKMIYQEAKHGNTVFVGYDRDGTAKYCSLRASNPDRTFKMDAENSDKSYPFCFEGRSNRIIVSESPIDLMSYATLTKLYGKDWRKDHRVSLGCLSTGALDRYLEGHKEINSIVFALDNDYLACDKNGYPSNWGQLAADKYSKIYSEKGYKCAVHTPHLKDFNLDLTEMRKGRSEESLEHQRISEVDNENELEM